tara:strand:+ start:391 stop:816 length:426 start_codon:yes stop_codon:yes gene_type:complete
MKGARSPCVIDEGRALIVPVVIAIVPLFIEVLVDVYADGLETFKQERFAPVVVLQMAIQYISFAVNAVLVMFTATVELEGGDDTVALTILLVGRLFESVSYTPISNGFVVPPFESHNLPILTFFVNSIGEKCMSSDIVLTL